MTITVGICVFCGICILWLVLRVWFVLLAPGLCSAEVFRVCNLRCIEPSCLVAVRLNLCFKLCASQSGHEKISRLLMRSLKLAASLFGLG